MLLGGHESVDGEVTPCLQYSGQTGGCDCISLFHSATLCVLHCGDPLLFVAGNHIHLFATKTKERAAS